MMSGAQRLKTARKDGRQVVTLRREQSDGQVVVHCEVYPVNSLRVEPIRRGRTSSTPRTRRRRSSKRPRALWNTSAAPS